MCDDFSLSDMQRVSRRGFTAMGAVGAALLAADTAIAAGPALTEKMVQIATPDGHVDAFFVHPAHGTHPGILMWPDIAGLRETYKVMARRLAQAGYAVVAVNQYYRNGPAPLLGGLADYFTPAGQAKIKPALEAITPERTALDAAAFVAWLDGQKPVARGRGLGTVGYCIGGGYVVRTAAVSARVKAAASLHGAGLVTDAPDSPHRLLARSQADFLFAIARNDDARAPGDKGALRAAAAAAHRPAEIEVYNADHGWCTLDAPSYNRAEAERAGARMLALFGKL